MTKRGLKLKNEKKDSPQLHWCWQGFERSVWWWGCWTGRYLLEFGIWWLLGWRSIPGLSRVENCINILQRYIHSFLYWSIILILSEPYIYQWKIFYWFSDYMGKDNILPMPLCIARLYIADIHIHTHYTFHFPLLHIQLNRWLS